MSAQDGEDYPTVIKDAIIKIYSGETLVETLTTDVHGEAETTLASAGTYRVTIEHAHRETLDFNVVSPAEGYVLRFSLANEPYQQCRMLSENAMAQGVAVEVNGVDGHEAMSLTVASDNQSKVLEGISETPTVAVSASSWLLVVMKQTNDSNYTQGTISPSEGNNNLTNPNENVTATTKQYNLYHYMVVDGVSCNTNNGTSELRDTVHVFAFQSVPMGTIHQLVAYFRRSWELTASGTQTNGTYEILEGQSSPHFTIPNPTNPPVCHEHWSVDNPPVFQGYHYAYCQWEVDGVKVATGTSYTISAKIVGTSHTVVCYWSCEGLT